MSTRRCGCGCGRILQGQRRARRYFSNACTDPKTCYGCGQPFDKEAPSWRVAISDPGPAASIDSLDRREGI